MLLAGASLLIRRVAHALPFPSDVADGLVLPIAVAPLAALAYAAREPQLGRGALLAYLQVWLVALIVLLALGSDQGRMRADIFVLVGVAGSGGACAARRSRAAASTRAAMDGVLGAVVALPVAYGLTIPCFLALMSIDYGWLYGVGPPRPSSPLIEPTLALTFAAPPLVAVEVADRVGRRLPWRRRSERHREAEYRRLDEVE